MRLKITYKGFEKQDRAQLKDFINEQITDLKKKLGSLANGDISLRGTIEKNAKHDLYRFSAAMHLPHKMIAAEEEGEDVRDVIRKTFGELERQAQKHKSRLKKEHLWKRKARRKELKSKTLSIETPSPAQKQPIITESADWFDTIKPYLDDLHHFAVHEIAYLRATGDILRDDILPDELVDSVIVLAFERQNEIPENMDIKAWLFKLAIEILDKEVEDSQIRRKHISLDTEIPNEDIDTTIYEFYQPDEMLKVVDLIGVSDTLPQEKKEQAISEQSEAQFAMFGLPKDWRRVAMLRHAVGFPVEQIAAIINMEQAMIEELLSIAARFMVDRTKKSRLPNGVKIERFFELTIKKPLPQSHFEEFQGKFK